jgi:hypothetical protein
MNREGDGGMADNHKEKLKDSEEVEDTARNKPENVPISTPAYMESDIYKVADKDTYIDEP